MDQSGSFNITPVMVVSFQVQVQSETDLVCLSNNHFLPGTGSLDLSAIKSCKLASLWNVKL